MNIEDRPEAAAAFSRTAQQLMAERGIPPTLPNYAVWFRYASAARPELNRAIDALIAEGQPFTPLVNRALFQRFFERAPDDEALFSATQDIEATLVRASTLVGGHGADTATYGRGLEAVSDEIEGGRSDLAAVVGRVVAETRGMLIRTKTLEKKLAGSTRRMTELTGKLAEMRREATIDGLTGIANRMRFDTIIRAACAAAAEGGPDVALIMLDIDHFKKFNDVFGHQMGDQVLRLVARAISECARDDDTVARYGGDEFAAVLPGANLDAAFRIAERMRVAVASRSITRRKEGEVLSDITLSLGVARFRPGESVEDLIRRADEALYIAKRASRNRVIGEVTWRAVAAARN